MVHKSGGEGGNGDCSALLPALTHLLADERGGRLDVVVVQEDDLVLDLFEPEDHAGCVCAELSIN